MDLIDKKILCAMDQNCRTPISHIARDLHINRNVAAYRKEQLEAKGIITKYICSINLGALGYQLYKIYFCLNTGKEEEKFLQHIIEEKRVITITKTEGMFDYGLTIGVKSTKELDEFLMEIKTKYEKIIKDYQIYIVIKSKVFKLAKILLLDKKKPLKQERYQEQEKIDIDEIDNKILQTISQEANISTKELAKRTNTSIDVVSYRLKKINQNLINSYRSIININQLGFYEYTLLLRIRKATPKNEVELFEWCAQHTKVAVCTKRIGQYDYSISFFVKNIQELNTFIKSVKEQFDTIIDSSTTLLTTKLHKLNYIIF